MPIVGSSIYEIEGRKYIDIDGMRIKIPFKYGHISGVKTNVSLYELKKGDKVKALEIDYKKWNGETFCVLKSITVDE